MADQLERAEETTELFMREALSRHRAPALKPTGFCFYCVSEIKPGLLFCPDSDCPRDYEDEQRRKRIAGR